MTKMILAPIEPYESMINRIWAKTVTIYRNRSKEVYKTMTAECPTVEVVEFHELTVRLVRDRGNRIASFNDLNEYMKQNGYKIIKETK